MNRVHSGNFIEKCCPVCGKYYLDKSKSHNKVACSNMCRYEWSQENKSEDEILTRKIQMRIGVFNAKGVEFTDQDIEIITKKLRDGVCDVCGKEVDYRHLHIDHDHATNKFRGVLCNNCNHALGNVFDDTRVLRGLISYLSTS